MDHVFLFNLFRFYRHILRTLLDYSNPIVLILGPCTSFVIQKLISVLPPSELGVIHGSILANFIHFSQDKRGSRIVQIMLEFSNDVQREQMTKLFCKADNPMVLACDPAGTYVAQARI